MGLWLSGRLLGWLRGGFRLGLRLGGGLLVSSLRGSSVGWVEQLQSGLAEKAVGLGKRGSGVGFEGTREKLGKAGGDLLCPRKGYLTWGPPKPNKARRNQLFFFEAGGLVPVSESFLRRFLCERKRKSNGRKRVKAILNLIKGDTAVCLGDP